MHFSKWLPEILNETEYLVFHSYDVFFSDQFSLLMYLCLLPLSATVKMDNGENIENARYQCRIYHCA